MSKLNLRVIAKIFYNQELEYDRNDATKDVVPSGHSLAISEAINAVLSNLATPFGLLKWLLGSKANSERIQTEFLLIRWYSEISFRVASSCLSRLSQVAAAHA